MTLSFPNINPIIFSFDFFGFELSLRYYSLSYIVGIIIAWKIILEISKREILWPKNFNRLNPKDVEDLIFHLAVGIVLGGRLGYVLFYQPAVIFYDPIFIFQVWKGGMSFHGGFLGVVAAGILFGYKRKIPILILGDVIATASPPGIFLGRLANFINGELWGKPTSAFTGIIFPNREAQECPIDWLTICTRHPTQLYEALFEGLILGLLLLFFLFKMRGLFYPGRTISLFLIFYGTSRFCIEYFRQADAQFISDSNPHGQIITFYYSMAEFGGLTMGQILCIPMIIFGIFLFKYSKNLR